MADDDISETIHCLGEFGHVTSELVDFGGHLVDPLVGRLSGFDQLCHIRVQRLDVDSEGLKSIVEVHICILARNFALEATSLAAVNGASPKAG